MKLDCASCAASHSLEPFIGKVGGDAEIEEIIKIAKCFLLQNGGSKYCPSMYREVYYKGKRVRDGAKEGKA